MGLAIIVFLVGPFGGLFFALIVNGLLGFVAICAGLVVLSVMVATVPKRRVWRPAHSNRLRQ
jgi:hypothetical protein